MSMADFMPPALVEVQRIVRAALLEDAPWGDLTGQYLIPPEARVEAQLVAREAGVLCGRFVFASAMNLCGVALTGSLREDGQTFAAGDVLATVEGPAQAVLQAERVALNFVQRLSGIATLTAQYVFATSGTRAQIVDTRKTTPGLRVLERYAVRCGGGGNHRFSLSDGVMAKDNHLAILLRSVKTDLTTALREARRRLPHMLRMEVEVDRLNQIEPVLAAGVDLLLLDNFTPDQLHAAVAQVAGRATLEASGGINLQTVRAIAESGVDLISVGALTHSVRALDLGLDIQNA